MLDPKATEAMITALRAWPEIIIMDTEQTCWEGSWERRKAGTPAPTDLREIVQIGAVRVETTCFMERAAFERIVQPAINTQVSPFCAAFTGITNARIADEGVAFSRAYQEFLAFCGDAPVLVYEADGVVMDENIAINTTPDHHKPTYLRIKPMLQACGLTMVGVNSGAIARHLGSQRITREHDALADVRSMANGLDILARAVDLDFVRDVPIIPAA